MEMEEITAFVLKQLFTIFGTICGGTQKVSGHLSLAAAFIYIYLVYCSNFEIRGVHHLLFSRELL